ncbi:MAG: glycosyltransferase family 4 protein [Candidatus Pacebacteria bacterium]|nr:glycosyltransferase family 4 protein [Candidatus Paceibacterota bacterium]
MKLLVITQKIDREDGVLGFFHGWVELMASKFTEVRVICLEKGSYNLPSNVSVYSLGKENGASRVKYIINFYRYIWRNRNSYDAVFVHMNQEYVLLGFPLWKILGKKIFLWRVHPLGTFLTDISVALSHKVFSTSPYAYVGRHKKTEIMPAGVDIEKFSPSGENRQNAILFLGRVAPIKRPEVLIDAMQNLVLHKRFCPNVVFVGNVSEKDEEYFKSLKKYVKERKISKYISFQSAVPHTEVPSILRNYEFYVNATPTGSLDKTIFEAMACGTIVITSNKALKNILPNKLIFEEGDMHSLTRSLIAVFSMSQAERNDLGNTLRKYVVEHNGLTALIDKLYLTISKSI